MGDDAINPYDDSSEITTQTYNIKHKEVTVKEHTNQTNKTQANQTQANQTQTNQTQTNKTHTNQTQTNITQTIETHSKENQSKTINKEKIYSDLKELLKTEEAVEVVSVSDSGKEDTSSCILESKVIMDAPMSDYTSFKVGGSADVLVDPGHEDRLIKTIDYLKEENIPYIIMGNGSNIIFRDGGFRGVVILMYSSVEGPELNYLVHDDKDDSLITVGAGMLLSTCAKFVAEESLSGLEFASGIPGTLGGAIFMNAGAYGGEMKDIVKNVVAYDPKTGKKEFISVDDMDLSYRHSAFQTNDKIILHVTMRLEPGDKNQIETQMKELLKKRNTKQPVNMPSAGSFFKRPEGHFAGKLIQDSGLKGLKKGGAQISELHSGFMVNAGGATTQDIEDLMQVVRTTVFDKFGVMLEPEVRIVGEPG